MTARTTFTLSSIVGSVFNFGYSVDNTSSSPVTASRVSIFGFNTFPDITGATSTGEFDTIDSNGNVPNLTGPDANRVCFGAGGGSCAGGGGNGVTIAEANSIGTFSLTFAPGTTSATLDQFYVRYQSLSTSQSREDSATGLGTVSTPVPEPATWAMMLMGFGVVGAAMRRKNASVRFAF